MSEIYKAISRLNGGWWGILGERIGVAICWVSVGFLLHAGWDIYEVLFK